MPQSILTNTDVPNARWELNRNDGTYIKLPPETEVVDSGIGRRYKVEDRLRNDGGVVIGDGTYRTRSLSMTLANYAETDSVFRANLNVFDSFFRDEERSFYIHDLNNNIRCEIVLDRIAIQYIAGNQNRMANLSITLLMTDSLWESITQYTEPSATGPTAPDTGTGSGYEITLQNEDTITITNDGYYDAFPVMTFTPVHSIITFTFLNNTQGGGFTFSTNDLTSGTELIVDCVNGTFTLEGVDKSSSVTAGGFIKLLPGDNVLEYTSDGGDCNFTITWRERSAF